MQPFPTLINCRSIRNKRALVKRFSASANLGFITITESRLSSDQPNSVTTVDGYESLKGSKNDRQGDDYLVYLR